MAGPAPVNPAAASAAPHAAREVDREAIRRAARGLEEVLLKQMIDAMVRAQLENGGFFGDGSAGGTRETTFEIMLSQALAERAPLGLADQLAGQLARDPAALAAAQGAGGPDPATLALPGGNTGVVFTKFTDGPQGHVGRTEKKGGGPRTARLTDLAGGLRASHEQDATPQAGQKTQRTTVRPRPSEEIR
jgi:hypothetical protein